MTSRVLRALHNDQDELPQALSVAQLQELLDALVDRSKNIYMYME
jgi:hypothetical protein